jgi:hypothetical protein
MNNAVRGVGWAENLGGVIESTTIKGKMSSRQQAKVPKHELQGLRPAPLKIWRGSHKIRWCFALVLVTSCTNKDPCGLSLRGALCVSVLGHSRCLWCLAH